ncbi:MAG: hypothetical protein WBB28_14390 [Crinalium sp.]
MTQYKNALVLCLPYAEKVRLMCFSVVREECGRELLRRAYQDDGEFDWVEFNAQFEQDYGDLTTEELMKTAEHLFGLDNLEKIAQRKKKHTQQAQELLHK